MRSFFVRLLIHVVSLGLAARWVDGISFPGNPPGVGQVVAVALLFGVLNAVVRPILAMASCGLYVVTLGLFHFVVNAIILQLTGWLAGGWLRVDGFWDAFQGALVISLVSTVLTWLLDPPAVRVARDEVHIRRSPPPTDYIDGE